MPRRCNTPNLDVLLDAQDGVLHRKQSLGRGLTDAANRHRLETGQWQRMLPEVYLTHAGDPSRRQLLIASLLYVGPDGAIDGADACRFHGIRGVPIDETKVYVVAPDGSAARSRGFVIVRRTSAPIITESTDRLRYVDAATAAISATRRMHQRRQVLAVLSDALQINACTIDALVRAHVQGPPRNSRLADDAIESLAAGTRSAPEADFRRLVEASTILEEVEYNVWLRLPCGRIVCVDALIASSGVVHETNGRSAHAREDLFEDMQERHGSLTASGLVVLHSPPSRIRLRPREVIAQFERCHLLYAGRGLPEGIVRLASAG
jgi:hypothetical protein